MLAFVVGCAASVETIAFAHQRPRRKSLAPAAFHSHHDVAVTVRQHRRERRIFDALGKEKSAGARIGIVPYAARKTGALERRRELAFEIRAHDVDANVGLAFGWNRNAACEIGDEIAAVEIRRGLF